MPNATATGSLDLDISKFEKAWTDAIADVAQLEPQLKHATAALKLMESQYAKLGAASGFTGQQIDKQASIVQDLSVKFKEAKKDVAAFGDAIGKTEGKKGFFQELSKFRTKAGLLASGLAIGGVVEFARALLSGARNASELTRNLDALDKSGYKDHLSEADLSARSLSKAFLDISGAISQIPLVGQAWDLLTAGAQGSAKFKLELIGINAELNKKYTNSGGLIDQLSRLEEQRSKLRDRGTGFEVLYFGPSQQDKKESALAAIEEKRKHIIEDITKTLKLENDARNDQIAGSSKSAQIAQIELERRKEIFDATEAAKNKFGEIGNKEAQDAIRLATHSADQNANKRIKIAIREYNILMDSLAAEDKITREKMMGSLGSLNAAREELRLAEQISKLKKGGTIEERTQAETKVREAKINVEMARRDLNLSQIQNRENKKTIEARALGYQGQVAVAKAEIQSARERINAHPAGSPERAQARNDLRQAKIDLRDANENVAQISAKIQQNYANSKLGIGYESEHNKILTDRLSLETQMLSLIRQKRFEEASQIAEQIRENVIVEMQTKQAYGDENRALQLQTEEMDLQMRGQNALADEVSVRAKYEAEIVKQLRLQNVEAANYLQKQESMELLKAKAAIHDETPLQRYQQRFAQQEIRRKARQQDERDAENIRRYNRGERSQLIDESLNRYRISQQEKNRKDTAKADAANLPENVAKILALLEKG